MSGLSFWDKVLWVVCAPETVKKEKKKTKVLPGALRRYRGRFPFFLKSSSVLLLCKYIFSYIDKQACWLTNHAEKVEQTVLSQIKRLTRVECYARCEKIRCQLKGDSRFFTQEKQLMGERSTWLQFDLGFVPKQCPQPPPLFWMPGHSLGCELARKARNLPRQSNGMFESQGEISVP